MDLKIKEKLGLEKLLVLLFSSYLLVNTRNVFIFRRDILSIDDSNPYISIFTVALQSLAVFAVLALACAIINYYNTHRLILFCASMAYAIGLVTQENLNIYFNIVICAVLFYIINYCFREPDGISLHFINSRLSFKAVLIFISVAALAYIIIISWACIMRFRIFAAATFDFGIFAQMFESMARNGTQITTLERNMQLSHFAIHFSPIFYVLLPFYMLFRTPESLLVMQATLIAAAVFPLALIARKLRFQNIHIILISLAYLFYPTITGGAFFDFHENKFLTLLVLWLLYFIMSEKYILMYTFAFLTLAVKEDAFIYVLGAALYVIAINFKDNKKMALHGAVIAALSVAYFIFVTWFLRTFGHGIMVFRYQLFLLWHEDSLLDVMRNVIKNPALLFMSIFSVIGKLEFLFFMLIPLCFLPFASKNLKFMFMILPMIVMNFATDYIYQYNIDFQYAFGVTALLFFLALVHLSKIARRHILKICVMMACFSCILFMSTQFNKLHRYNFVYTVLEQDFIDTQEILARLPPDASVTATMFIPAHIAHLEQVFAADLYAEYFFDFDTEFIIIDMRGIADWERLRQEHALMREKGYRLWDAGGIIEVFRREPAGYYP